mmetsp:Transcript_15962/g.38846  ORF Transcript_15962/g.38846 Transcript_15962/m.38846 type:complete len:223 (-) Transcript_15962:1101-1769(-)
MRDEPQVGDADGVPLVLNLLRPRLRDGRPRILVKLGPLLHLFDVGTGIVAVRFVEGLDEVEVVDDLGADGSVTATDDGDAVRTVLQRRAHVLHGERTHAGDHDVLAVPIGAGEVVGDAVRHDAAEARRAGNLQTARDAHAVVDGEDHAEGAGDERALAHLRHDLVPATLRVVHLCHAQNLDAASHGARGQGVAQRRDILQNLRRGAVITVGRRSILTLTLVG